MNMSDKSLIDLLCDIVGYRPYAILAYGSRVAGYAGPESDYDYIFIAENFRDKIKYIYRDVDGTYISILLVDKDFFEEDIYLGAHGEFVGGRLYSVFKPILNKDYIENLEVVLKKRAILEELRLLKLKYGDLLKHMKIPLKYFLFARLKKRIIAYPPVKYSYYKTFYGESGSENLRRALQAFEKASIEISSENLFKYSDGYITSISLDRIPASLREILKYLFRGVSMYITHGRSASVTLNVVLDEVKGKVRRGTRSIRVPKELDNPEILLEMDNIYFSPESMDVDELVKALFGSDATVKDVRKAGWMSNLYILTVDLKGREKKLVIKNFPIISIILKWIWLVIWLYGLKKFTLNPWERLNKEVDGLYTLYNAGFNVPRLYAVIWRDRTLVEEYIEGVRLDKVDRDIEKYFYLAGKMLGEIHSKLGASIGDTKPQNFIVKDGRIYLVDLEQFNRDDCFGWDIAELILYSLIFFRKFKARINIINSVLKGYVDANKNYSSHLKEAVKLRILFAFLPLVPINIFYEFRKKVYSHLYTT